MDYSKSVYESRKWLYARVLRISILLIWLISVCSMCFADESVDLINVPNMFFNSYTIDKVTYTDTSNSITYFEIEPGFVYHVTIGNFERVIGYANDVPAIGVQVYDRYSSKSDSFDVTYGSFQYLYLYCSGAYNPSNFVVTREPLLGQKGAIDKIIYYVLNDLWPSFGQLATVISFTVVFALGYYLFKYYIQRISKGKE